MSRDEFQDKKKIGVNCLTRSLWHWDKYGGDIIYDSNHVKVVTSSRYYHDHVEQFNPIDISKFGIDYFLSAHKDFLNDDEIEILKRYFNEQI